MCSRYGIKHKHHGKIQKMTLKFLKSFFLPIKKIPFWCTYFKYWAQHSQQSMCKNVHLKLIWSSSPPNWSNQVDNFQSHCIFSATISAFVCQYWTIFHGNTMWRFKSYLLWLISISKTNTIKHVLFPALVAIGDTIWHVFMSFFMVNQFQLVNQLFLYAYTKLK